MGSGCGGSIVEKVLRPPGKLPVPVALNALSPTLFRDNYTPFDRKCKHLFYRYYKIKYIFRFCRIFLLSSLLFSLSFLPASFYNDTT